MPPDNPTSFRRKTILAVADLYEHISGHVMLLHSSGCEVSAGLQFVVGVWCAAQVLRREHCVNSGALYVEWNDRIHGIDKNLHEVESGGMEGLRIAIRVVDADNSMRVTERLNHLRCRISDGLCESNDVNTQTWSFYVDPRGQFSHKHPRWTPWERRMGELTSIIVSMRDEEGGVRQPDRGTDQAGCLGDVSPQPQYEQP